MERYFGTDGIRGVAGARLNAELALRAAYGFVTQIANKKRRHSQRDRPTVVVGADPRLSSPMLEAAVVSGIAQGGCDVIRLGTVPTPLVSLLVMQQGVAGGVMITASHNPIADNGIKFFAADGTKISFRQEQAIEKLIAAPGRLEATGSLHFGRVTGHDPKPGYLAFLRRAVPARRTDKPIRVVLDCAYGATSELAPLAFAQAHCEVRLLHTVFDGSRINVRCGATELNPVRTAVRREKADIGLAFDGDGDRVLAVDHEGRVVSGDKIIALFATRLSRYRQQQAVVMTHMTNMGVEQALARRGVALKRTAVGDIQVLAAMKRFGLNLGGEQSGHIILRDRLTTGDGILAGLQLAHIVRNARRTLSELMAGFPEYPQHLVNIVISNKQAIDQDRVLKKRLSKVKTQYPTVRFYLRPSGTENLLRILTEARDEKLCRQANAAVCDVITAWDRKRP